MKITFVLPGYIEYPVGGVKIVYEYANRLAARGHKVHIVHPHQRQKARSFIESTISFLRRIKAKRRPFWFPIRPDVQSLLVADYREKFVPAADIIFATAWDTAPHVHSYGSDKGEKFYLIQHYELWDGSKEEVDQTWRLPLKKIVIAKWLRFSSPNVIAKSRSHLAITFGEEKRTFYIPNGLDFSHLKVVKLIENRSPHIVMLYHLWAWKGSADGIRALEMVHERYPNCQITLFGVPDRGDDIPTWITYIQKPSHEQLLDLYNNCSVFVHTSWTEGWGLTPAEAMACGCALVATDNEGVQDYARHQVNALIVEKKQPHAIAQGIIRYLEDEELRTHLAKQGNQDIQQFTWERAVFAMEKVIQNR